jgi:hypothetical protein
MFTPRPTGVTLRRVENYLHHPHDSAERIDPGFRVALRCELCGKLAYGPRSLIGEAMREHRESDCPKRHTHPDAPQVTRILFPRSK